ncbi:MAG: SPOR domain-containing protein [Alphaproteobacteria bacterium]
MNPSDDRLRAMMDRIEDAKPADDAAPGGGWRFGRRRSLALLVAVVIALGLGWGLTRWTEPQPRSPDEAPLVVADPTPTKHRPAEPGGLVIPFQDDEVYDVMDPTSQDGEVVERLLPPPEEPVAPLVDEPGAAPAGEPATIGELLADTAEPAVPSAEPDVAAAPTADAAGEPVPETAVGSGASEPWRVQVGAVKDSAKVDAEWARIKAKLGALIDGLPTAVESVDLGADQGIFHRLQIGAFALRDDAKALCARIKLRQVDCLVVQP